MMYQGSGVLDCWWVWVCVWVWELIRFLLVYMYVIKCILYIFRPVLYNVSLMNYNTLD